MDNLRITLVQTSLHWENAEKNIRHFSELLSKIDATDVIVLPEMFCTGFSMNPESHYEEMNGSTVQWMKESAMKKNAVITGSLIIRENGKFYNRLIWCTPDGGINTYDKRHLFQMAGEDKHYAAGKNKIILEYKDWRICPLICYDLRFPVWSRNIPESYDVLIYVANWPAVRSHPWKSLLIARAIENQCYVVGVNRVGADGNGIDHTGDSAVIDPKGQYLFESVNPETMVKTISINKTELRDFRKKFPVLGDGDKFTVG